MDTFGINVIVHKHKSAFIQLSNVIGRILVIAQQIFNQKYFDVSALFLKSLAKPKTVIFKFFFDDLIKLLEKIFF